MSTETQHFQRTAALEVEVTNLKKGLEEANEKLDQLLAFKHKGTGAFLLASSLFGTGIIGFFIEVLHWIKN